MIRPATPPLNADFDDFSDLILKSVVEETFLQKKRNLAGVKKAFRWGGQDFLDDMIKQAMKNQRTSEELDRDLFGDCDDA